MSFFDQSRLNKVLKQVGRVKAKAEMALIGGGERLSAGKTKAIAAKAAGDPSIAARTHVTYTGGKPAGIGSLQNPGSHYNPATDTIQTAPNAAVAAHEGTHAAQARWISKTAERLGLPPEAAKQAPTAIFAAANMGAKGAAGAAATDKLGTGGRVTGAVLGHLPQLALEGHATVKGTLSQPGGVRTALGSFGSYATAAGANIRKAMKPRELSARETLQSIIQLAAWTRKEGKSRSGGLNEKGRKSYERENPGSDLKAPSKEAGNPRRASFCARMSGMKKKLTSSKTANDPDSRINKSLKAWNCSAKDELDLILFKKKGGDYKRHWSQKKPKGKPLSKKQQAEEDEQHQMSAREQLDEIQFAHIGVRDVGRLTGPGAALLGGGLIGAPIVAGVAGHHLGKKDGQKKERMRQYARVLIAGGHIQRHRLPAASELSAREELEVIQLGILDKFKGIFKKGLSQAHADKSVAEALAARKLATRKTPPTAGYDPAVNQSKNSGRGIGTIGRGIDSFEHSGGTLGKGLYDETSRRAQERLYGSRFSAREELEVIQLGIGSWLTGAGKRIGSVAGDLAMPDALGSLGGQLAQGAKLATMGGARGITSGLKVGAEDAGSAMKNLWGKLKPAKSAYASGMNPFQNSMVHASARDQLNTILLAAGDWRERTSDNAGAIAAASGAVGGLSSYVRGGVQNAANWKSASQIKGALAGGAVAGLGGYAIAKLLKKDKPGQAQIAGRIGSGHQNSLSAREQLNTIQFGLLGSGLAINYMSGGGLFRGIKDAFSGGIAKQAAGSGLDSLARKGLQNAGKGGSYMLPGNTHGIKVRSSVFPANRLHGQLRREWSARDQLSTILMGANIEFRIMADPDDKRSPEEKQAAFAKMKRRSQVSMMVRHYIKTGERKSPEDFDIKFAADTRPRDPMGRFDQAEDGAPNPQHMKITYGQAAATGAAGVGAGVGLKALYDKLKKMKK